ncbi:hypothetical protein BDZ89DRAFT_1042220 [Hymenopellis radicata]|nr:hypothetical protein BDZ89DRAFT_1042220 [Hymenopellis radicata]
MSVSVQDTSPAGDAKASPAEVTSPDSHGMSSPPPYPVVSTPPSWFPPQCVYDPLIPAHDYVDDQYPLRSGVLFSSVPRGPLKPAYLPAAPDGSKTFFYCITVGVKVGIVTDASLAAEFTNGVSGGFKKKRHSHSAPSNISTRTLLPAKSISASGGSLAATATMSMRTSDPPPHSEDDVIWLLTDSEDERPSSLRTSNKPHQPSLPPAITTKQDAAKDDLAEDTLAAAFAGLAVSSPSRLYAVNQGGTTRITSHWSDAGYSQQQSNAHVSRVSPKKRPTKKRAGAYVVFVDFRDACEAQILHQTGSIYQGYRTRTMADAAYDYASKHGLVHPTSGPRTIYSSRRVQAPVPDVWSAQTPLSAGVRRNAWYAIFAGTRPGLYNN